MINPPLGTRQTGFRLFGNPVQAIESDLTATALVLANADTRVVVIGIDLSIVGIDLSLRGQRPAQDMRTRIAEALERARRPRAPQHEPHARGRGAARLHAGSTGADGVEGALPRAP